MNAEPQRVVSSPSTASSGALSALSDDCVSWHPEEGPRLLPEPGELRVVCPEVVLTADGRFRLYYESQPAAAADATGAAGALGGAIAELEGAGGDLVALVELARENKSSTLAAALKELGFKSLRKRQQLQKELEALAKPS